MSNFIKQSIATIQQFTITELSEMVTTLNGEQSPLNLKRVEAITESFMDGYGLLQMPEVTRYEGTNIYTGGRHRLAALQQEYAGSLDSVVHCLVYQANDADEVVQRVLSSNGSRSMNAAEKKELTTSSKYGFDVVSTEMLVAKIELLMTPGNSYNSTEAMDCFVLALAIELDSTYDCGKMTGLAVARSFVTSLKKCKQVTRIAAQYDGEVQLTSGSVSKSDMLVTQLGMGQERISEMMDTIVQCVEYVQYTPCQLPAKLYLEAQAMNGVVESDVTPVIDAKGVATYESTITRPANWQRTAAKFTKVIAPMMKHYISEALDIEIA